MSLFRRVVSVIHKAKIIPDFGRSVYIFERKTHRNGWQDKLFAGLYLFASVVHLSCKMVGSLAIIGLTPEEE